MLVWLLVLILGMACDVFAQGRVFYEPGDGSSRAVTDCVSTTTSRDGVSHRNGSALECGWDGTLGWQDSAKTRELELASVPMKSERLISAWFRVDANVDAKAGSKLMRVGYGSANEIIASCQFENTPASIWMGINGHASYWGGETAAQCRGDWKRIRIYQSPSLVRLWLGDVLLREWTGAFAISSMVTFMSQWSNNPGWEHDALNHVYWDEIEIFTDAGTGGSGSMRDGTMTQGGPVIISPPPPAPVNLTIITAVKTCRVTIQSQPPDELGGWGVQFRWDLNNFGSKDTSAPFERARDFPAGTYQLGAIWTKTGQTPVYVPTQSYTCQ